MSWLDQFLIGVSNLAANGIAATKERGLNFIAGSNITITAVDNQTLARTDVTISAPLVGGTPGGSLGGASVSVATVLQADGTAGKFPVIAYDSPWAQVTSGSTSIYAIETVAKAFSTTGNTLVTTTFQASANSRLYKVQATLAGLCTGGASGTVGHAYYVEFEGLVYQSSGGATTWNSGSGATAGTAETIGTSLAAPTVALTISGGNFSLNVTGPTSVNADWTAVIQVQTVA